jgi:hypothetical protein
LFGINYSVSLYGFELNDLTISTAGFPLEEQGSRQHDFGADANAQLKREGINIRVSDTFHEQRISCTEGRFFNLSTGWVKDDDRLEA